MKKEHGVSRLVRRKILLIYAFIFLGLFLIFAYSLVLNKKIGTWPAVGLFLIFIVICLIIKKTTVYMYKELSIFDELRMDRDKAFEALTKRTAELEKSNQAALIMAKNADAKSLTIEKERENIRIVFDSAPISMLLVDENTKIIEANWAAAHMMDSDLSDMLGLPLGNGLCCIHAINAAGGCGTAEACSTCMLRETITTVFKNNKPVRDMNLFKRFLVDGKETSKWLEVNADPLILRGVRYVLLALNDITIRKQSEERVIQSEEKFKNMTDLLPEAVFECDLNGRLIFANRALFDRFGYTDTDFNDGIYIFQMIFKDDRKKISTAFTRLSKSGGADKSECDALTKDGRTFPVIMYAAPIIREGNACGVRGIIADVSELKLKEAELTQAKEYAESANSAKSAFLANMSHEIRTPLNVIMGTAEILEQSGLTGDKRHLVDMLRANGEILLKIINDIIDISKIEAGKIGLEHIGFNVRALIENTCLSFENNAREKGLNLKRRIAPDLPTETVGDPVRVQQVLINLIGNALKFTYHGYVCVSCWFVADTAEFFFSVADTGIGLDGDKQETIFESFTQADTSTTRRFGGTGLGLTISKRLVELMGGRIWVEGMPGEGSTFYFTLPHDMVARVGAEKRERENFEKPCENRSSDFKRIRPSRVLLVDDYSYNQEIISYFLKDLPIDLDLASNGAVAVEKFKKQPYDIILMDLQMPVMDGYSATRAIRKIESTRTADRTPIIALSAFALKKEREKSMEAGCDAHLNKPVKRNYLIDTISKYLTSETVDIDLPENGSREDRPELKTTPSDGPLIYAERLYEELIPRYLDDLRNEILKMASLLKSGKYDAIRKKAHNIKGSGGGYGFDEISEIGGSLENAAKSEDGPRVEKGLKTLSDYINQVKIVYR